jgi:predicted RNase H-like HicB family nuclease
MFEPKYEVYLYWDKRDKVYVAEVPELPGCLTHGRTRAEAVDAAEAAIDAWIRSAREDGLKIPSPVGRATISNL